MLGVNLAGYTKENTPVTLSQSDLSDLLDAVRAGGDLDIIRTSVELRHGTQVIESATSRHSGSNPNL